MIMEQRQSLSHLQSKLRQNWVYRFLKSQVERSGPFTKYNAGELGIITVKNSNYEKMVKLLKEIERKVA